MIVFFSLFFSAPVFAKKTLGDAFTQLNPVAERAGIEEKEVEPIIGRAVKGGLVAVGVIFFVLMVYAGITWMNARGDEGQAEKAQKTIVAATVGIVLVVGSYAMTNLVVDRLIKGQKGPVVPGAAEGRLVNEGPLGCCVDWVSSDPAEDNPIPACRITTQRDCQLQGETVNDYDRFACGGPSAECWIFNSNTQDANVCSRACKGLFDRYYADPLNRAGGAVREGAGSVVDWFDEFIHEGGVDLPDPPPEEDRLEFGF